jgi:glycosyltransferase involved in cell wall biosynthesis
MRRFISVIIPTYNPDINRLIQTLNGLRGQTIDGDNWELIIIDNNSSPDALIGLDMNGIPNARIVNEQKQGLTFARLKGFNEAKGDIIIMVDDDNVLDNDYLLNVFAIFNEYRQIGAIGGKSIPVFEVAPPKWLPAFYVCLALRDLGDEILIEGWNDNYPAVAPIGAGMAIRKKALKAYLSKASSGKTLISDRTGDTLSSGGDNDIVLELLKSDWQVGYFPALKLQHLIPAGRTNVTYLSKLLRQTNASWIKLLEGHGINPWPKISKWTVLLRQIKAWFSYRAWKSEVNYIKWQGACGTFEGLSNIL